MLSTGWLLSYKLFCPLLAIYGFLDKNSFSTDFNDVGLTLMREFLGPSVTEISEKSKNIGRHSWD